MPVPSAPQFLTPGDGEVWPRDTIATWISGGVSSPFVVAIGTGVATGNLGGLEVPNPEHQAGDILVIVAETGSGGSPTIPGWTNLHNRDNGASRLRVMWLRALNGATPNPTITNYSNHALAKIFSIRGVDPTADASVFDAHKASDTFDSLGTTIQAPSIVTSVSNSLVFLVATNALDTDDNGQFGDWTNPNLEDITELTNINTLSGNGGGIGVAVGVKVTPGATGVSTVMLSTASERISAINAFSSS